MNFPSHDRRHFIKTAAVAGVGLAVGGAALAELSPMKKTRLGFDNFSVRALKWNASQLIDYAASLKLDSLFLTDLDVYTSFDDAYLKDLKKKAEDNGIKLLAGSWSICPTSKHFKNKWGTAEEMLSLGIRVAKTLGSPAFRCILGMGNDRDSDGGIEARMADTVKVCQSARSQTLDAGVKIAIENHAGDMQSWEIAQLCEMAGKDYVGVTLDLGNSVWTMEDPLESLEILAPYVAATAWRDSMIWETPNGATIQWTAMGEGCIDYKAFAKRFAELCPEIPVNVEIISGFPKEISYNKKDFWKVWPKARAKDFAKFIALTKKGHLIPPHKSANEKAEQEYQKAELERSLKYCKETLGLGLKGA